MPMMEDFVELPLHPSGVYMLVWRGRVVYVGQSVNVLSRISTHRANYERALKGKPPRTHTNESRVIRFDKAFVKFCEVRELDRLELELIVKHKPEFNVQLRERRAIVIDLGALGFDGDKFREPILHRPFSMRADNLDRPPAVRMTNLRKPRIKPDISSVAFVSPFNQLVKRNKFPRPRLSA